MVVAPIALSIDSSIRVQTLLDCAGRICSKTTGFVFADSCIQIKKKEKHLYTNEKKLRNEIMLKMDFKKGGFPAEV